ncbi:MAG: histidine kinase [Chitinophagaceae bacterium]
MNFGLSIGGLFTTHIYRNFVLKHRWHEQALEKVLPNILIGLFVLTLLLGLIYHAFFGLLYPVSLKNISFKSVAGSLVSIFMLLLVWNIIYFVWTSIESTRKNTIKQLQVEKDLKDMEMKTLLSNLQPHFIFNALNSIRALIDENPEQARRAITQISNILRSSIRNDVHTDSLENELALVQDYLSLEKIRYENRLEYSFDIAPETQKIIIPSMMLQTIVENAIKHGIAKQELGGSIFISAHILKNKLQLCIKNHGSLENNMQHPESLGFGIHSTIRRLQYLYQQDATFEIKQEQDMVLAIITLPIKNQHI